MIKITDIWSQIAILKPPGGLQGWWTNVVHLQGQYNQNLNCSVLHHFNIDGVKLVVEKPDIHEIWTSELKSALEVKVNCPLSSLRPGPSLYRKFQSSVENAKFGPAWPF